MLFRGSQDQKTPKNNLGQLFGWTARKTTTMTLFTTSACLPVPRLELGTAVIVGQCSGVSRSDGELVYTLTFDECNFVDLFFDTTVFISYHSEAAHVFRYKIKFLFVFLQRFTNILRTGIKKTK